MYVLHAARDAAVALQPREIAVALYSLRPQTHKGLSSQALLPLQDLRRRLLQQSAFLLPYFLPEDLLVFLASVEDAPPELMRQAFGFMYTAVSYYTPQQLASVSHYLLHCLLRRAFAWLRLNPLFQHQLVPLLPLLLHFVVDFAVTSAAQSAVTTKLRV